VLGLVALEDVLELLVGEVRDPAHREMPEPRVSGEPEQVLAS
jgi:CBS domain containing-hemolysin-like protein